MENYNQGDLTDIIRATGGNKAAEATTAAVSPAEWQFPSNNYSTEPVHDDFGDPFTNFRDPLLHDIDNPVPGFFETGNTLGFGNNIGHKILDDDEMKRPNYFSRMLQISPISNAKLPVTPPCDSPATTAAVASPTGLKVPPILVSNDLISTNISKGNNNCLVESTGLQISSPRNTGIRRRKSQAKKVVCIPAPAPANSRPSGEIVPSDLWAWRKYGQKPIKGSPYPRGYYRCSSSKGCSARKQVERSRTDPNMLVITYTSEHNHPWPTQRNALAGSTRSQPSKHTTTTPKSPPISDQPPQKFTNPKEEQKENTVPSPAVKEEILDRDFDNQLEMDGADFDDQGFPNSYKPTLPDSNQSEDSFFADLGEIDGDSLDILLTQGFSGDNHGRDKNALDPFSFYDWVGNDNSTSTSSAAAAANSGATTSHGDAN
ncbi:hypothetical protein DH2020_017698 [Rehmannia glutinosa]|uniref:WRKY domain-containing protein n=1 Tax=Rehmannia glutinosa TaxID=99300 RepID=A0ABR0WRP0_REHGL